MVTFHILSQRRFLGAPNTQIKTLAMCTAIFLSRNYIFSNLGWNKKRFSCTLFVLHHSSNAIQEPWSNLFPREGFLIRPGLLCQLFQVTIHFPSSFTWLTAPICCGFLFLVMHLSPLLPSGQWISGFLVPGNICSSTLEPHVRRGHCQDARRGLLQTSSLLIQPRETACQHGE